MKRRHAIFLLGSVLAPRAHAGTAAITFERGLMGTRFAITCHHPDQIQARGAANEAFNEAEQINRVASDYIADSELLELSKHPPGKPIAVSALLFRLISEAAILADRTDGGFDPTLGPLTKLWRESRRRKELPDAKTLSAARTACGWKNLALDLTQQTVSFEKPSMRLDLGGIAKGQAADVMLAVMRKHGISRTCITAGGDVRLGDPPPGATGWRIGTRGNVNSQMFVLTNCAVSTSGDLHQFIEIGGTRYSHIIDPATGLGMTRQTSATVIAPTATLSDALATASCVSNAESVALAAGAKQVYLTNR